MHGTGDPLIHHADHIDWPRAGMSVRGTERARY
jgi:hypothetical protein